MVVVFEHNGVLYEMTADEIEAAYRYQERMNRLCDAKRQFLEFAYGCDPDALEHGDREYQEISFEEEYGFPICDGLLMLNAFVDRYEDLFDCNVAENITWHDAIEQELGDARK